MAKLCPCENNLIYVGVFAMAYWYVVFTKTGCEKKISDLLNFKFRQDNSFHSFVPEKEIHVRRQGAFEKEKRICFPGYTFISVDQTTVYFNDEVYQFIIRLNDVYKFLTYGDGSDMVMREEEQCALSRFMNDDYCIQESIGFYEGDNVIITSGPLVGMESKIIKIDRHKHMAKLEITFMQDKRPISVALKMLSKQYL